MIALVFGIFGLITGSFLNVIILRRGVRSLRGRSGCMSCGAQLSWYDMVPVFSWLTLRGRCRTCGGRISVQYPLVEAATAILFALIGGWGGAAFITTGDFGVTLVRLITLNYLVIAALLVAIFVYDLHHTIIPDGWVYTFIALTFLGQFLLPFWGEYGYWLFFSGPVVALPILALWGASSIRYGTPGMWMGLGDAKLALGIGWLLGPAAGLLAVFGAFVIGAIISLVLLLFSSEQWKSITRLLTPTSISRRPAWGFTMKSEIPFGPFLIVGCLIVWFSSLFNIPIPFFPML
ncbi:MAG: prepilin peptidase [bacterium]|nr:prepilin peptidase [bacterium]